jgi:hypothetical protein
MSFQSIMDKRLDRLDGAPAGAWTCDYRLPQGNFRRPWHVGGEEPIRADLAFATGHDGPRRCVAAAAGAVLP